MFLSRQNPGSHVCPSEDAECAGQSGSDGPQAFRALGRRADDRPPPGRRAVDRLSHGVALTGAAWVGAQRSSNSSRSAPCGPASNASSAVAAKPRPSPSRSGWPSACPEPLISCSQPRLPGATARLRRSPLAGWARRRFLALVGVQEQAKASARRSHGGSGHRSELRGSAWGLRRPEGRCRSLRLWLGLGGEGWRRTRRQRGLGCGSELVGAGVAFGFSCRLCRRIRA